MRRYRLALEYDGTGFSGFQRQPNSRTVQGTLEPGLSHLCGHPVNVTGAGRTDAGVHALGQVVHFDSNGRIPPERISRVLNDWLAPEILVRGIDEAPGGSTFHARYSAVSRTYWYYLCEERVSPFMARYVTLAERLLPDGADRIRHGLRKLVGRHNFAAFTAGAESAEEKVRTIRSASLERRGQLLRLELTADGFLRGMVRNLTGMLFEIGSGRRDPEEIGKRISEGRLVQDWVTAPPQGLFLARVEYPDGCFGWESDLHVHGPEGIGPR